MVCILRPNPPNHRNLYQQILDGIAAVQGDLIALAEHFTGDRRAPHGRYRKSIPYWVRHTRYLL